MGTEDIRNCMVVNNSIMCSMTTCMICCINASPFVYPYPYRSAACMNWDFNGKNSISLIIVDFRIVDTQAWGRNYVKGLLIPTSKKSTLSSSFFPLKFM